MAGGGQDADSDEGMNEINIVPLVDIMLVLLVIFMVTTEFVERDVEAPRPLPAVPIDLPSAKTAEAQPKVALLSIAMARTGALYLNGDATTLDGIKSKIAALRSAGDKVQAFVAADQRVMHGDVLGVVDALRLLGVTDVAINTKPLEIE